MNALRLLRKAKFLSPKYKIQWYPPFWLMRIKVLKLQHDWSDVRILLPLNFISKNMGDSMFGGYQAALADPIAALACIARFPGYSVWTRAMVIDFVHEGNSDLELRFSFDPQIGQQIQRDLDSKGRSTPEFEYGFYRADGKQCTLIKNKVAIRPKNYRSSIYDREKL